jgi:hypothetical protein
MGRETKSKLEGKNPTAETWSMNEDSQNPDVGVGCEGEASGYMNITTDEQDQKAIGPRA